MLYTFKPYDNSGVKGLNVTVRCTDFLGPVVVQQELLHVFETSAAPTVGMVCPVPGALTDDLAC